MAEQKTGAAAEYLARIADIEPETVTFTLNVSGAKQTFVKPTVFGAIFGAGELPAAAADEAAAAWREDGIGVIPEDEQRQPSATEKEKADIAAGKKALEIRNRVFSESVSPKIVDHKPRNDNELHWSSYLKPDLEQIYKWVAAYGDAGIMLAMFPERREQRPLASLSRKKQRTKTK